jgi:hypothetical protein
VIVKITDDKPSFKNMHIAERKRIQAEIIEIAKDSSILMGVDLAIHAHDKDQQAIFLELKSLQVRPVLYYSLPNSSFTYRTRVIFVVPIKDSTEEPRGPSRPECDPRETPKHERKTGRDRRDNNPYVFFPPTGQSKDGVDELSGKHFSAQPIQVLQVLAVRTHLPILRIQQQPLQEVWKAAP